MQQKGAQPSASRGRALSQERKPRLLREIDSSAEARVSLGINEVDRLLGGGIVPGSLILIGGEPGIGKSTLSLQIPLGCPSLRTLYVTGEESERQVKMRADRLAAALPQGSAGECLIYCETCIDSVLEQARGVAPDLMIVDSVQTMYTEAMESTPGSVSQIKEVAAHLLSTATGSRATCSSSVPATL